MTRIDLPQAAWTDTDTRNFVEVEFRLAPEFSTRHAEVAGDFSAWVPWSMPTRADGGYSLSLLLERGRSWRYRFLVDSTRWMNDPRAFDFVADNRGGMVSVLQT